MQLKSFFQKILFLPLASVAILIISIVIANYVLLPLMKVELKNPQVYEWFFLAFMSLLAFYKVYFLLKTIINKRKSGKFIHYFLGVLKSASVNFLKMTLKFLFAFAFLAFVITMIALNNSYIFK